MDIKKITGVGAGVLNGSTSESESKSQSQSESKSQSQSESTKQNMKSNDDWWDKRSADASRDMQTHAPATAALRLMRGCTWANPH